MPRNDWNKNYDGVNLTTEPASPLPAVRHRVHHCTPCSKPGTKRTHNTTPSFLRLISVAGSNISHSPDQAGHIGLNPHPRSIPERKAEYRRSIMCLLLFLQYPCSPSRPQSQPQSQTTSQTHAYPHTILPCATVSQRTQYVRTGGTVSASLPRATNQSTSTGAGVSISSSTSVVSEAAKANYILAQNCEQRKDLVIKVPACAVCASRRR